MQLQVSPSSQGDTSYLIFSSRNNLRWLLTYLVVWFCFKVNLLFYYKRWHLCCLLFAPYFNKTAINIPVHSCYSMSLMTLLGQIARSLTDLVQMLLRLVNNSVHFQVQLPLLPFFHWRTSNHLKICSDLTSEKLCIISF